MNTGSAAPYSAYSAVYDRTGQSRFSLRMLGYAKDLWGGEWPRSVLDIGCGTGAAAVALALRDVRVTGLDKSGEMLACARERADRWGARVTWVEADYRDFALEDRFDAAICFYDAINYCLTEQDLEAVLRNAYLHVRPGGSLIFDCITSFGIRHAWGNQVDSRVEDDIVRVWRASFNRDSSFGRLDITYFVRDLANPSCWTRFDEGHVHRGYDAVEVHAALRNVGWEPRASYTCFTLDPITVTTYRGAYHAVRRM